MGYKPTEDYAGKDFLESGDPEKLILGTELQADFDAIEAAFDEVDNDLKDLDYVDIDGDTMTGPLTSPKVISDEFVGGEVSASEVTATEFIGGGSGISGLTLDQLSDVSASSPSRDEILQYNGSAWSAVELDLFETELEFMGVTDVTATAPAATNGHLYANNVTGVADASWTGIAGDNVPEAQMVVYVTKDARWYAIGGIAEGGVMSVGAGVGIAVDDVKASEPVVSVDRVETDTWYADKADTEEAFNDVDGVVTDLANDVKDNADDIAQNKQDIEDNTDGLEAEIKDRIDGDKALDLRIDAIEDSVTDGGGFIDAPNDGKLYGRQSESWEEILGGGDVDSVNGKTGVVVLDHSDVGAAAEDHTHDEFAADASQIEQNKQDIATNAGNISTNADNISDNAGDIADTNKRIDELALNDLTDVDAAAPNRDDYLVFNGVDWTSEELALVDTELTYQGAVDMTGPAPDSPANGDLYINDTDGVVGASWGVIAGSTVNAGNVVGWADKTSRWYLMGDIASASVTDVKGGYLITVDDSVASEPVINFDATEADKIYLKIEDQFWKAVTGGIAYNDGNVGIGRDTNVDHILDIAKPSDAYIRISSSTTQENAGIIFANQNSSKWTLEKDGPEHSLYLKDDSSTVATFAQGGNVEVNGGISAKPSGDTIGLTVIADTSNHGVYVNAASLASDKMPLYVNRGSGGTGYVLYGSGAGASYYNYVNSDDISIGNSGSGKSLKIKADSSIKLMTSTKGPSEDAAESHTVTMDGSGNVGIGTSDPTTKATIAGAVDNSNLPIGSASASDAQLTIANDNAVTYGLGSELLFQVATPGSAPVAGIRGVYADYNSLGDYSGALTFGTQANASTGIVNRMTIDSSGNVGIGGEPGTREAGEYLERAKTQLAAWTAELKSRDVPKADVKAVTLEITDGDFSAFPTAEALAEKLSERAIGGGDAKLQVDGDGYFSQASNYANVTLNNDGTSKAGIIHFTNSTGLSGQVAASDDHFYIKSKGAIHLRTGGTDTSDEGFVVHPDNTTVINNLNNKITAAGTAKLQVAGDAYLDGITETLVVQGINHGKTGLSFNAPNNEIQPVINGAAVGDQVTLGNSTRRFKDGYFSGQVSATEFVGDGSKLTGIATGGAVSSVNGKTGTVVLTHADVGAQVAGSYAAASHTHSEYAPTSHTHAYVPLSGNSTVAGTVTATDFVASSDERLKENITTCPSVIDQLHGREWNWKNGGKKGSGVIAQELEAVLPHLVHEDDAGMKSVSYLGLIGYLIEEVKSLKQEVEELKR